MKISLVINGKETLYDVNTFEFSLKKYIERDLVLIFNETSFLNEITKEKGVENKHTTVAAAGVGVPTASGYKQEKFPDELPLDSEGILYLDKVRERMGVKVVEQVGKENLVLLEIKTEFYTPTLLPEAIINLVQLEYDKIPNHSLIFDKPPVVVFDETQDHLCLREFIWIPRGEEK